MTDNDYWWEPPFAGTEVDHLLGSLNRLRTTFRWKADGLDGAGLKARIPSSDLSLGGLLKHLATVEDDITTSRLVGGLPGGPWVELGWRGGNDWTFETAVDDDPDTLYAFWDDAVERSRARVDAALAEGGPDQLVEQSDGNDHHASLRRLLFDLLEEYGRHTGHADLLREAVDGRVGEDPPAGWRPVSGRWIG